MVRSVSQSLFRISQSLNQMQQRHATVHGLSPIQLRTLMFLRGTRPGARTVSYLTKVMGVRQATVSDAVQSLITKGILSKSTSVQDKRIFILNLSPEGETICNEAEKWTHEVASVLDELPYQDLDYLHVTLRRIVEMLASRQWCLITDVCRTCGYFHTNQGPSADNKHWCSLLRIGVSDSASQLQCPEHTQQSFTSLE